VLGLDWYGSQKKRVRTHYGELVFLHQAGSAGHLVHFGVFRARNIDALFSVLMWDRYGFHKKGSRTHYSELVFLHLVRSVGDVVHSGASGA
jgi:hypothetical protein